MNSCSLITGLPSYMDRNEKIHLIFKVDKDVVTSVKKPNGIQLLQIRWKLGCLVDLQYYFLQPRTIGISPMCAAFCILTNCNQLVSKIRNCHSSANSIIFEVVVKSCKIISLSRTHIILMHSKSYLNSINCLFV